MRSWFEKLYSQSTSHSYSNRKSPITDKLSLCLWDSSEGPKDSRASQLYKGTALGEALILLQRTIFYFYFNIILGDEMNRRDLSSVDSLDGLCGSSGTPASTDEDSLSLYSEFELKPQKLETRIGINHFNRYTPWKAVLRQKILMWSNLE